MNQPYCRDGIQSAFVNTSIFDGEYFDALFGGSSFPNGEFMIDHKEGIMKFQKWFLEEMKAIKDRGNMFTFPVNTISLLKKDGKFVDEEFARWACEHNRKWNDSNFFVDDSVTSLSNCCRLKSNIKDLGYFNSIGGTALKVGSVKVSTINLARLALETNSEKEYLAVLKQRLIVNLNALHVVRNILKKNVERGLLPNFQDGLIDFEHLYNTIGINGIYETMVKFGYVDRDELGNTIYKPEAYAFGEKILRLIKETGQEYQKDKDYKVNAEEVPGESAASKFLIADSLLFDGRANHELPLYGNQWIPLGIKTTIQERIKICSKFDEYCDGGSICHLNLDAAIPTKKLAWDLLNYVTDQGVKYFAFTGKLSQDEDNHLFYGETCPECGKKKVAEFARIVGFYTKTASWSKERKEEFAMRKWDNENTIKLSTTDVV
jgi:ribonucleoside-triphosphate reductase